MKTWKRGCVYFVKNLTLNGIFKQDSENPKNRMSLYWRVYRVNDNPLDKIVERSRFLPLKPSYYGFHHRG